MSSNSYLATTFMYQTAEGYSGEILNHVVWISVDLLSGDETLMLDKCQIGAGLMSGWGAGRIHMAVDLHIILSKGKSQVFWTLAFWKNRLSNFAKDCCTNCSNPLDVEHFRAVLCNFFCRKLLELLSRAVLFKRLVFERSVFFPLD